jgi:two-component system, sensor histidine kinase LadS
MPASTAHTMTSRHDAAGRPDPVCAFALVCRWLLFAALSCLMWGAQAQAQVPAQALEERPLAMAPPVLTLTTARDLKPVDMLPFQGVLRDNGRTWTVDTARQRPDAFAIPRHVPSDGYVRDRDLWFKLRLKAQEGAPLLWWLQVNRAYLDEVRLWHFGPDGQQVGAERAAGDRVVSVGAQRQWVPTFELDLTAPGVHEVYLRVRTDSALIAPLKLLPRELALARVPTESVPIVLLLGASVAVFLVACIAAVWLRDRLFALYAVFVLANTLVWTGVTGLLHVLFFEARPPLADQWTASAIALSSALGPWLYVLVLRVPLNPPAARVVLKALVGLMGAAVVAPWVGLGSVLTPWVIWALGISQLIVSRGVLQQWGAQGAGERVLSAFVLGVCGLTWLNAALVLGWVSPSVLTDVAGVGAHVLHLTVLLVYLLRQTRLARLQADGASLRAQAAELQHRLERDSREDKSNLIAMLAHEIRTPVSVIDASLQSLTVLDEDITPERARRHERIARSLHRLTQLVDLALTRDRLDVAQWVQECAAVNLADVVRQCVEIIGDTALARVRLTAGDALPPVWADERMVRYVVLNLIDNALKYSPVSTEVSVSVHARANLQGAAGVCLTVQDQGSGVHPRDRDRVFDKYYRSGEVSEAPGLGLGLYLVQQIVLRHHGFVRVVPTPQASGACFEAWLPLPAPEGVAP